MNNSELFCISRGISLSILALIIYLCKNTDDNNQDRNERIPLNFTINKA